jgi:hypothetical protein
LIILQCGLKNKWDHNLAQGFAWFELFYPEHFSHRVKINLPGIKSSEWVGLPNLYSRERWILNNHRTHRFSDQLCSEHHENLGRARIDKNKNDVALATNETDAITKSHDKRGWLKFKIRFIHWYYVLKSVLVVERNINTWGVTPWLVYHFSINWQACKMIFCELASLKWWCLDPSISFFSLVSVFT